MAFPTTPLDLLVEMQIGGLWQNITDDVKVREDVSVTRGKSDEAGQVAAATCTMLLNNAAGKYSPRNPVGPWYGQIGRNTQIRVGVQVDPVYDAFSSSSGTGDMTFTHTPVGAPTGILVFTWELGTASGTINSVTYGGKVMSRKTFGLFTLGYNAVGSVYFLNTEVPAGPQSVVVDTNGSAIQRQVSVQSLTGGTTCEIDAQTTAYSNGIPNTNPFKNITTFKRAWLFGTLLSDLDDGSTIAPGAGWNQSVETDLGGDMVSTTRTTQVQNPGVYSTSWTAASANWAIMGVAIRAIQYRFWGEVSAFPRRWDPSGADTWVSIECSTLLRRLAQGRDPADPSLRSFIMQAPKLSRYWPLSGRKGTTYSLDIAPWSSKPSGMRFASEYNDRFQYTYGEDLGMETVGTGMALFNTTNGPIRANVAIAFANHCVDFVWQSLRLGELTVLFSDYSGFVFMIVMDGVTGKAQVSVIDPDLGPIGFALTPVLPELLDNGAHHFRFEWTYTAPDTTFTLYLDGQPVSTGSYGFQWNSFAVIRYDYIRATADYSWVNLAHVATYSSATPGGWPSISDTYEAFQAYSGEQAGERLQRLLALTGYPLQFEGTAADTVEMGPQHSEDLLSQLRDAESTDMGILAEPRDQFALKYRTLRTVTNQDAVVLNYADGEVAPPFEPLEDDLLTRNDITVTQRDGGTWRVQQNTGPLNVQEPPLGVGRYRDDVTVNVNTVEQAGVAAGWLLNRGTVDLERYPSVTINLARIAADGKTALLAQLATLDLGDRLTVSNVPGTYGLVELLILGSNETLNAFKWLLTFNCVPAAPYEVVELDDGGLSRISSGEASTLTAGVTSGATSLSVTSTAGTLWTTSAGEMPIPLMIGGEEMTVTAISGASSPQTFTVVRAVNGVAKAHSAGAVIRLKREAVWGL